ncbi:MAG: Fe-S cluster assembly protein SufD [Candidatus Zhuqueibacterota bacterium]
MNDYFFDIKILNELVSRRSEPGWVKDARNAALTQFVNQPWPGIRDEEWRRTNISHINFQSYEILNGYKDAGKSEPVDELPGKSGLAEFRGHQCISAKIRKSLDDRGVIFTTLSDAMNRHAALVQRYLPAQKEDGKFESLNKSLWTHGAFLYVPAFAEISEPFLLSFHEAGAKSASFPNVMVILEKGARAELRTDISSEVGQEIFRNALVHLYVEDGAALKYFEFQNLNDASLNFSNNHARVARDGEIQSVVINTGSALSKTNFRCELQGPGANAHVNGIYFANHNQHFDLRTVQHHEAPQAASNLLYKGVVKDRAHTIYQGMIKVFPDAQQTDAYQSNKNLVLDDHARADSIPGLEIQANDVKCSHGSTTGRVNDDEIFYLMSRGISLDEARKMIISGFFEDVILKLPADLQDAVREQLETKLES